MKALTSTENTSDGLVSAVLLFSQESPDPLLYIAASRRLTRSDLRDTFPARQGILKNTIDEGAALITRKDLRRSRTRTFIRTSSVQLRLLFSFAAWSGNIRRFIALPSRRGYFTVERRELLDIISNQAKIAIQNARLYHELEQEKERMMEVQEEARKKLSRDLHDGPTQSVAAIAMRVNFARRLIDRNSNAAAEELYKIEELARKTTKEIRHMLFTLRPSDSGVSRALCCA